MAEIKIEKKATVWPWVLLAILIIGALVYFFGFRDSDETTSTNEDTTQNMVTPTDVDQSQANGPVAEYVQYIDGNRTMALDHEYSKTALSRLVNAVKYKADQLNHDVSADLDKVKEHADRITNDPFETTHANSIRKAAEILGGAMQRMQQAKYPDLNNQAKEVLDAASEIKPDVLTLDQKDVVKGFFNKSADLLQNMN